MKIDLSDFGDFLDFCPGVINAYCQDHYGITYPIEEFCSVYRDPEPGFYYAIYLLVTEPQRQFNLIYREKLQELQIMAFEMNSLVYSYNVSPKNLRSGKFDCYIGDLDNSGEYYLKRKSNGRAKIKTPKSYHTNTNTNPYEIGRILPSKFWVDLCRREIFPLTKEQLKAYGWLTESKKLKSKKHDK